MYFQIEDRLHYLISNAGSTCERAADVSTQVVIFGSRAVGVQRPDSDLDVLLVDPKISRPRVTGIDFVVLRSEELATPRWLGSELASHIAEYGKWVQGSDSWRHQVHLSDQAAVRKQARIVGLLMRAPNWWSKLHPVFHTKYQLMVRRELQRLDLIRRKIPVPPTRILDSDWDQHRGARDYLINVAATLPLNPVAFDLAKTFIGSSIAPSSPVLDQKGIDQHSCL